MVIFPRSTGLTTSRLLLVGLLLACLVGLAPSGAAMQVKPGRMVGLRCNPTSGVAHIPAPRQRAGAPLSTFQVTYHDVPAQAQTAFKAATDIWATLVSSPVPIRIDVTWKSLGVNGFLGLGGPAETYADFLGAPVAGTLYPKALANALAGRELDTFHPDISVQLNSDYPSWYFGTDGNTPLNKVDFESVALHECCHGLGFLGSTDMTGSIGSWGDEGVPMIYDRFVVNGSNQSLINTTLFPMGSTALCAQLTGNNLYWNGPKAIAANGGVKPKLFVPSSWEPGSSVNHLDNTTYPIGSSPNALMDSASTYGVSLHDPGPIVMGMFADMGWTGETTTAATPTFSPDAGTYTSAQKVTISCTTAGATIYYTTNGNDPTTSDTKYLSPVAITAATTLKAKAFATGMSASTVKRAFYNFQQITYRITSSADSNGTIFPTQQQTVTSGASLIYYATPSFGYAVDRWWVDGTVVQTGGSQYALQNITANHTVLVSFKVITFTVTSTADVNGTIYPSTTQTLNYGTDFTFEAVPSSGYMVDRWWVDNVAVQTGGNQYTLPNIIANHTVKVTFKLLMFTITPSAGANGTISPSMPQTVSSGVNITFQATANAGYTVDRWSLDGTDWQTGGATFTLAIITADHTVSVSFKALHFTVTPVAGSGGAIDPSTTQTVNGGANLTFTATPNSGYAVDGWYLDGATSPVQVGGTTYALMNILDNHTVRVTFKSGTILVTPTAGTGGSISPNTVQTVSAGASLTFTATPGSGYAVDGWYLDSASSPTQAGGTTYLLTNITANHTVKVTFKAGSILVTPTAGIGGSISPDTVQTVSVGASLTFTATPNSGYAVDGWYLDGATSPVQVGGTSYTLIKIQDNHTIKVTFKSGTILVTPMAGTGGSISPSTVQTVSVGASLSFTATPNSGYVVNGWCLDGTTNPVQVGGVTYTMANITVNHTVKVTFKAASYTITPVAGTGGTINPQTPQSVSYGTSLTFTAAPGSGYLVDGWYLDNAVTPVQVGGTSYTLTAISAVHTVKVTFKLATFILTSSAGANGSINPSTAQSVSAGTNYTFTATPDTGFAVDGWYLDGATTPAQVGDVTYTLTNILANHTVKVTFKPGDILITPVAGTGGAISPGTGQTVNYGAKLTFTALPYSGYAVNNWYLDGATTPTQVGGITYTLTNITTVHSIKVTFKPAMYTITPSAGTGGTISPNTPQTVSYGTRYTLTATPSSGYVVDGWYVDSGATPVQVGGATYTLPTLTANHSVKVTFKTVFFTVTPSAGANGTVSPNTPQSIPLGGSVTFTAKPNTGFQLATWTYDGNILYIGGQAANGAFTGLACALNNLKANHTLAVAFKPLANYTITVTPGAGANGTISPNTPRAVPYGGSLTFTATANAGYVPDTWSLDGASIQTGGTQYTLQNIIVPHTVKVTFRSLRYKPDLSICNNGDAGYIGLGVIGLDGASQTKTQTVASGIAATYLFRAQNAGETTETFKLTCTLPALSGWQVQCVDRVTGKDVTAAFIGSGYTTVALAPGVAGGFTLKITPTSTAVSGAAYAVLITATSSHDATKKDAVKATTVKK